MQWCARRKLVRRCSVEQCGKRILKQAADYCSRHQRQFELYGDPLGVYVREPAPIKHGTTGGYTSRGCRCDECRDANREAKKQWRHTERGRRLTRERYKRWSEANPEKVRGRVRRWATRNPDKIRAQGRTYYARNRELALARQQAWKQSNPQNRRHLSEQQRAWTAERQEASDAAAINARTPWTEPELAIALDRNVSATQAAFAVGRSLRAIYAARARYVTA